MLYMISIIHLTIKSSKILERVVVSEIRRNSSSQDTSSMFGIGVIRASFQTSGNSPAARDITYWIC